MSVFSQTLWICCWVVMFLLSTSNATTAILSTPSASLATSTVNIASPKSPIPNSSLGKSGEVLSLVYYDVFVNIFLALH